MWTTPLVREPEDFYILFVFILVRLISCQMSKTAIKFGHNGSSPGKIVPRGTPLLISQTGGCEDEQAQTLLSYLFNVNFN